MASADLLAGLGTFTATASGPAGGAILSRNRKYFPILITFTNS